MVQYEHNVRQSIGSMYVFMEVCTEYILITKLTINDVGRMGRFQRTIYILY